jgi:hypothetical protein
MIHCYEFENLSLYNNGQKEIILFCTEFVVLVIKIKI